MIRIKHTLPSGEVVYSQYAHMLSGSILVNKDDKVNKGEAIGKVGETGFASDNHLHFEIKIMNYSGCGYISHEECTNTPINNDWDNYYDPLQFVHDHFYTLTVYEFFKKDDINPVFADSNSDISNPNFEAQYKVKNHGSETITIDKLALAIHDSDNEWLWDMADPETGQERYYNNVVLTPGETKYFEESVSFFQTEGDFKVVAKAEINNEWRNLESLDFTVLPEPSLQPDIKANGSDGPLTINENDILSVIVNLFSGNRAGLNADWWLLAYTPSGDWYYYNIDGGGLSSGFSVTAQGAVGNLSSYEVLNRSDLPEGTYTFYFGLDMYMNGSIDAEQLYYDSLVVKIEEGTTTSTSTIPDTGQTISYTDTFGEDSDYTINPPSYTDNGNGTVTDNVTGLIWQQEDDNTERNWSDAVSYCSSLSLGGNSDWRLPAVLELSRIVYNDSINPAINTTYFPNANLYFYWSSTPDAANSNYSWYVYFSSGRVDDRSKSSSSYVRCVRAVQSAADAKSFTDNGNGTVLDNDTGLIWRQEEGGSMDWEAALAYCEGLSLAGDNDWRLPNKDELQSLVDYTLSYPALSTTYFPNISSSLYWSSTTHANYSPYAWYVDFSDGRVSYGNKSYDLYVRCVRAEQ